MTTSEHYQNDIRKDSKTNDPFRKRKDMVKHDVLSEERKKKYIRWISFWRLNPHRFIQDFFGIHLYPYQVLMIWILQRSNLAYIVASRAAAKTWIIAVWSLTLAVLYPGIKIIVCAKTIKQGAIILSEKLTSLRDTYPNVAREIKTITTNANVNEAIFHCGSTIKVVPSSESSRGNRANYIIIEESRLVPKEILEAIIKPFLFSRTPPYRLKPEYANDDNLKEEGIISYITSSWYKSEYWYQYVKSTIRRMLKGDETANFLALDYLICLYHNIKTKKMLQNEMNDADPVTVSMEYENIPSGESGQSYFKLAQFNRNLKRAFYPQRNEDYNPKRNPFEIKKVDGELRIMSVDVATRANKANDNTIMGCSRLIPLKGKGYQRQFVYMESHKGKNTVLQAKRIKEIFYDFECDHLVLDLQNAGIGIFDGLSQNTNSEERGIQFPPFTVSDSLFIDEKIKEELRERTLGLNALPVVFPISATAPLNSQIAVAFRKSLQNKLWNFLLPDGEAEEFLIKTYKNFMSNDDESARAFYLNPYLQTSLMIAECVNLDMSLVSGNIKLSERTGNYKDRYSMVSYMNWIVSSVFDIELLKQVDERDDLSAILGVTMVL
jgi:hypothetical protein